MTAGIELESMRSIKTMAKFFNKLKNLLPGAITRDAAKRIARDACAPAMEPCAVYDAPDPRWILYNLPDLVEPCWYVALVHAVPRLDSTTVMVISRRTGKVLYCDSACDEG